MFEIRDTRWLAENVKRFSIHAPRIAARQRAGQFVIVRVHTMGSASR